MININRINLKVDRLKNFWVDTYIHSIFLIGYLGLKKGELFSGKERSNNEHAVEILLQILKSSYAQPSTN